MAATRRLQKVCSSSASQLQWLKWRLLLFFQELQELKSSGLRCFRDIQVDEHNILSWIGVIVPVRGYLHVHPCHWDCVTHCLLIVFSLSSQDNPPYNRGAFRIEINFPAEYPFKPPKITFKTKIYHPNIDEKGQICLPIIQAENWKPATRTDQGLFCFYLLTCSFYLTV